MNWITGNGREDIFTLHKALLFVLTRGDQSCGVDGSGCTRGRGHYVSW